MTPKQVSSDVFPRLREILFTISPDYVVQADTPDNFSLNMKGMVYKKKPVFFAAVQRKKNYVTFHLMPVYMNPALQKQIPAELKKRMQGKACFNFTEVDEPLFAQLQKLVKVAATAYPASLKMFGSRP